MKIRKALSAASRKNALFAALKSPDFKPNPLLTR
jgi:hypothetical protein